MTNEKILEIIRNNKKTIKGFGVKKIGLFGSYAAGIQRENSDIDIIVEFEQGRKNYDNFIHLCFLLEDLLGREVDLLTSEGVSPFIKPYIYKETVYEELS